MKTMKLSDIKIKDSFANSNPQIRKIEECRNYWNENHEQDRYLVVNHKNDKQVEDNEQVQWIHAYNKHKKGE